MLAESLRVIASGVAMGQIFKERLKPDHALAMFCGLDRGAVPVAELSEEEALRFLRKQEAEGCGFRRGDESGDARGSGPGFRQADSEPGKQYVSQLVADIQPVIVHVMAKKLFYSMGEVSEMFDVNASLIRFGRRNSISCARRRTRRATVFFSGRCRKPEIDLSSGQGAGNDPRRSCPLSETE